LIRALWRAPLLLLLAAAFAVVARAGRLSHRDPAAARRQALTAAAWAGRWVLRLLSVSVDIKNAGQVEAAGGPCLFVANHVSFLDIFVIGAHFPVVFVPSVELREAPVVGWFASLGGSFFVERRHRSSLPGEIEDLRRLLEAGFSVALFPEGTTGNGEALRPFKSGFFEAPLRAGRPVLPLCINFLEVNGAPLSRDNRDTFFYYGGQNLLRQIGRLVLARSVRAEVIVGAPLSVVADRKALAEAARSSIEAVYRPVR